MQNVYDFKANLLLAGTTSSRDRIAVVIIVLLLFSAIACIGRGTSQRSLLAHDGEIVDGDKDRTRIQIGETAEIGNLEVTISKVEATDGRDEVTKDFEFRFPATKDEDGLFLLVNVTLENVSDEKVDISSRQEFNLFNNKRTTQKWALLPVSMGSIDGRIDPGRERQGVLVWDVHEDATGLTMVYGDTVFTIGDASNYRPGSSDN